MANLRETTGVVVLVQIACGYRVLDDIQHAHLDRMEGHLPHSHVEASVRHSLDREHLAPHLRDAEDQTDVNCVGA